MFILFSQLAELLEAITAIGNVLFKIIEFIEWLQSQFEND